MNYPKEVQHLIDVISLLPGVAACFCAPKHLSSVTPVELSLPGEFGDLPQVAVMRTGGGRENEVLIQTEIIFERTHEAWISLEFLAWWVRDWARSGHQIQMRPVALPPRGFQIQLGRTLKFLLEYILVEEGDEFEATLKKVESMAESIAESFEDYRECFESPAEFTGEVDDI